MIIFLYGSDSYRRQQKQKEIISQYKNKHSTLTIERFDLEEAGVAEKLKNFIEARSLFDNFKLAVVSSLDDSLAELFKNNVIAKEVILLVNNINKPTKKFDFLLTPPVIFQEFDLLNSQQFKKFIEVEAKKRGLVINKSDLDNLSIQCGSDCWSVIAELDRLVLTDARGSSLNFRKQYNFFELINNLTSNYLSQRLRSLELLLEREDSAKVFNLVAYSRGVGKKEAAEYDLAIKSGKLDYEVALLDLVIK